jgi:superfamily II DNA or RNA helicase
MSDRPSFVVSEAGDTFDVETTQAALALEHIPGASILRSAGGDVDVLRVPFTQHACEVLANLRIPHLPRMVMDYDWPGQFKPMPHQIVTAGVTSTHRRLFNLNGLGTGKTIATLWACDYLMGIGAVKSVLVICPLSIMRMAWLNEIRTHFPHRTATVVHHTNPAERRRRATSPADFRIINYAGVEVAYDELLANQPDMVVLDESTNLKTASTRRWKFCRPICQAAERMVLLTGTPSTQAPTDAHGQVAMAYGLDWPVSETAFKNLTMEQHSKYRWVPKPEALEVVFNAMQPAIRFDKRDVLKDLPPMTETMRKVELSAEQKRLMKELRKTAMAESECGATITAVHAAALRVKLLQIASGIVYDDNGDTVEVEYTARINELLDLIKQVRDEDDGGPKPNHKVLVCAQFVATAERLQREINKAGFKAALIHGDVPLKQREAVVKSMQEDDQYEVLVVQPDTVSHGVTLTSCTATIMFTPLDKAETFHQVCNRTDRPGQRFPTQIIKLSGCGAEDLLYERLAMRMEFHHDILDMYGEFVQAL